MAELAQLLKEHYDNHPSMEIRDAVKFLYQSYMGGGHLIADEQQALARLEVEWARIPAHSPSPLTQPLGNGFYRLNLSACKGIGLSVSTVFSLFLLTAQDCTPDPEGLMHSLALLATLPFPAQDRADYLTQYRAQGCPMLSHSEGYREAYSPAYRIVSKYYVTLIPLLIQLEQLLAQLPQVRVALDGPCASGKSTLGATLSNIYGCPLLHMDDFFLRPEQRTPARLEEIGGNVDYTRFQQQVLDPLCRAEGISYRPWQCRVGRFGDVISLPPAPALTVVEGSYSLRPEWQGCYHLRVWVEAPWPVREARLNARGGPDCLERFRQVWIPMEDRYFHHAQVQACCQLEISGDTR